jgi:integrase
VVVATMGSSVQIGLPVRRVHCGGLEIGYTRENPALGLLKKVLPPKNKRRRQMPDPFSQVDLKLLLDAAEQHLPENICLVLKTMAYSGMRLGEALAMHRNHLDVANCQ